jgi:peptidyl-prolyl cis-trans isomerase A (cyclophilin A)
MAGLAMGLSGAAWGQEPPAAPEPEPTPVEWVGPKVTLQTTLGEIVVTLDTVGAPKTAAQFLGLVKSGHYNGALVYRVEPGFVAQFGDVDPKLKYRQPKLPPVALETANNKHAKGALAMARGDDPNSGQSTIYFDLGENTGLGADPAAPPNTTGYAVFAHVTSGMDVLEAMGATELQAEGGPFPGKLPKTPIIITKATVTAAK